ncbi:hypothetical protein L3Y34_006080 [Caenorhabditis briggsae]|uniref:Uncharacterized protein n=1 Tax=Caenorhabditis briggsae TaxID=6238 RepID=A0AAE9CYF4_CAEBR|nr:hypothetical protein L3Y34_006080 [Caenorhabditis briggsae]
MASSGPFGSIRNKKDANKKQFEDEQKMREEKEREDQEQYMRQVEARNREREKMARRMEDTPRIDIRSEMFLEASSGDVPRPATSLMNLKDQKKVMRSISSARLPTRSALEVPVHPNTLSAPEPPMELQVLNSSGALSILQEEPAFNLPQVSEKKAQKIDALNLSMKRQEAKGLKIERSSDWSAELGSGHSSVGPPSVVEIERKNEVMVKPEIPIKVKLAGEKKEPIDLNSSSSEVQSTPVQPAIVPTEHLIPVQKSKCCCHPDPGHPGHPDPGHPDPGHPDPGHPDPGHPGHAEPGHPDPGHPDPGHPDQGCHPDPGHPDPGHPDPGHPDPVHPDPGHPDPGHPDPGHPDPGHSDPAHPDPAHPDPAHPVPGHPDPGHPDPGHPDPGHPNPGHPDPGYPDPGHPDPGHPDPGSRT